MSEIKDRGLKKWTSIMLPEHVKMLKELEYDYYKEAKKPILDEYEIQIIDERLKTAYEYKLPLIFELWYNGIIEELEGIIEKIDKNQGIVWIVELNGNLHKIKFDNIVEVDFMD